MSYYTLKNYLNFCEDNTIEPTTEGLKKYYKYIKYSLMKIELGVKNNKKVIAW